MYNIDHETILAAAKAKYGDDVRITAPYWVSLDGYVRIGVQLGEFGASFGANFWFVDGEFR